MLCLLVHLNHHNNSASKKPNVQKIVHLDPTDSSGRKRTCRDSKDDPEDSDDEDTQTSSCKSNQKRSKKRARTVKVEDEKVSN